LKPKKTENSKKRKVESLLSTATEINLNTSSDEDEEYFAFSSSFSKSRNTKLAKASHPAPELGVILNVNHEAHLLRGLADTGASSRIIFEAYTSKKFIKNNDDKKTTWRTMDIQFITDKTGFVKYTSRIQSQEKNLLDISCG
jgi:hypothetical protein